MSPKDSCLPSTLVVTLLSTIMTLFRYRVFVVVIRLWIEIRSYWIIMGLKSSESIPIRDKKTHTQKRSFDMRSVDIGVNRPQAKQCRGPPEAERGEEQILPWNLQKEHVPTDIFVSNFQPPGLWGNEDTIVAVICYASPRRLIQPYNKKWKSIWVNCNYRACIF